MWNIKTKVSVFVKTSLFAVDDVTLIKQLESYLRPNRRRCTLDRPLSPGSGFRAAPSGHPSKNTQLLSSLDSEMSFIVIYSCYSMLETSKTNNLVKDGDDSHDRVMINSDLWDWRLQITAGTSSCQSFLNKVSLNESTWPFVLQITFYEGKCFTGRKLEVRGDCDNFQDRGFMNR